MHAKVLGLALTLIRRAEGLKQTEAAARVGIAASLLSIYEHGDPRLTPARLEAVVLGMGVPAEAAAERIERAVFCAVLTLPPAETAPSPIVLAEAVSRRIETASARAGRIAFETAHQEYLRAAKAAQAREDRRLAKGFWARMKKRTHSARLALVEEEPPKYQTWAFAERLCAASERAAAEDPQQALELAELALRVAERMTGDPAWLSRLVGYVWAFLGNARRVASDLPGAEKAFCQAWKLWEAGAAADSGLLDGSRLLDLEASLLRARRHFGAALERLEQALALNPTGAGRGRILLKKGTVLEQMGSYEAAVEAFQAAAPWIDREREPRWYFGLRFNWIACLCHGDRYQEAAEALSELRALTAQPEKAMDRAKVRWLAGRVAGGLGRAAEGIEMLAAVRAELAEKTKIYDQALVSMELAGLYLQQGRTTEVKRLVQQMEPVFRDQGVHAEARKALDLFRQAVELETLSAELVRRLVAYLYRARHNPELSFEA
jgi:tetratricopeptide (TPR) repeat protein/transcriptional regulator with XRE-family HTH domain